MQVERKTRQLRNLVSSKGEGYEHLSQEHLILLDKYASYLPPAPSGEEKVLKLFSTSSFPHWLQIWEREVRQALEEKIRHSPAEQQNQTEKQTTPGWLKTNIYDTFFGTPRSGSSTSEKNYKDHEESSYTNPSESQMLDPGETERQGSSPAVTEKIKATASTSQPQSVGDKLIHDGDEQINRAESSKPPSTPRNQRAETPASRVADLSSPSSQGEKNGVEKGLRTPPPAPSADHSPAYSSVSIDSSKGKKQTEKTTKTPSLEHKNTANGSNDGPVGSSHNNPIYIPSSSSVSPELTYTSAVSSPVIGSENNPETESPQQREPASNSADKSDDHDHNDDGKSDDSNGDAGESDDGKGDDGKGDDGKGDDGKGDDGKGDHGKGDHGKGGHGKGDGGMGDGGKGHDSKGDGDSGDNNKSGKSNSDNTAGNGSDTPNPHRAPSSGNGGQDPHGRPGMTSSQGYASAPKTSAQAPGTRAKEPNKAVDDEFDYLKFDPEIWESQVGYDERGYMKRPGCFQRGYDTTKDPIAGWSKYKTSWHRVLDVSDGNKEKYGLLRGKVRGNSLVFEVPGESGSSLILLPPTLYRSVTEAWNNRVPEVPYGNPRSLHNLSLSDNPPDELCFAAGKGFDKKGNTAFIWHNPERWFPKNEVVNAAGARQVNTYLKDKVPGWNLPKKTPSKAESFTQPAPADAESKPTHVPAWHSRPKQTNPIPENMPAPDNYSHAPPFEPLHRSNSQQPSGSWRYQTRGGTGVPPGYPPYQSHPSRPPTRYSQGGQPTYAEGYATFPQTQPPRDGFSAAPFYGESSWPGFPPRFAYPSYYYEAQRPYYDWPPASYPPPASQQGVRFSEEPPQMYFDERQNESKDNRHDNYGPQRHPSVSPNPPQKHQPRQWPGHGVPTPPASYYRPSAGQ